LPFFGQLIPVWGFTGSSSAFSKASIVIIDALDLPRFCSMLCLTPVASHSKWSSGPLLPLLP